MGFSIRLKELRNEKNVSQAALSKAIGVSTGCIGMLETGKREPTSNTLLLLSNYFGVTTDYLLGREDDFGNVETNADLSEEEKEILATYRALPVQRRKTFMYFVQSCKEELNVKNYKI